MSNPYDSVNRKNSVLGPTLKFKGDLSADEDLLIQGQIEGTIRHTSNLTIGAEGCVDANVDAVFVNVEGKVRGDVRGSSSIIIKESANIEGNIISPTVSLYEGATFNGSITMKDPAEVAAKPRPEARQETVADTSAKADSAAKEELEATTDEDTAPARKRRTSRKSASAA